MKNNVLCLKEKLLEKALIEWAESLQNMSPEEICINIEEIREKTN